MLDFHRLRPIQTSLLCIAFCSFGFSPARAQFRNNGFGDVLRTREEEPLVDEPFFEDMGIEVELTVQEVATPENSWFAVAPEPLQPAIALQDLRLSLISATGETEQRLVVNAVVQNLSYEPSLEGDADQVLLMEGDRVLAAQTLDASLQPGQSLPVQYELEGQRPEQPWRLVYRSGDEAIALYPEADGGEGSRRAVVPELQEQDWLKSAGRRR